MIEERDEREEFHRALNQELEAQAERLKVRRVIARHADGTDEVLNMIQTVTDEGITVYVQAPRSPYVNDGLISDLRKLIDGRNMQNYVNVRELEELLNRHYGQSISRGREGSA